MSTHQDNTLVIRHLSSAAHSAPGGHAAKHEHSPPIRGIESLQISRYLPQQLLGMSRIAVGTFPMKEFSTSVSTVVCLLHPRRSKVSTLNKEVAREPGVYLSNVSLI